MKKTCTKFPRRFREVMRFVQPKDSLVYFDESSHCKLRQIPSKKKKKKENPKKLVMSYQHTKQLRLGREF